MERYRAGSLFQPSNLAEAIASTLDESGACQSHLYGTAMLFPHTIVARTVAVLGFDFVLVDALHTPIDAENLVQIVQTINFTSGGKTVAVVRVPSVHSHLLTHALDAGAAGIIFPQIDTFEEAEEAVRSCRYASSNGHRSLSPSALLPGITDMAPGSSHVQVADENIAVICQIESTLAVQNAERIASVPGMNALMIGPGDLRLSLQHTTGLPGEENEQKYLEAVNEIIRVSKKYKKPMVSVTFKEGAESILMMQKFSLLVCSTDARSVVTGHQNDLARFKTITSQSRPYEEAKTNGHSEQA